MTTCVVSPVTPRLCGFLLKYDSFWNQEEKVNPARMPKPICIASNVSFCSRCSLMRSLIGEKVSVKDPWKSETIGSASACKIEGNLR